MTRKAPSCGSGSVAHLVLNDLMFAAMEAGYRLAPIKAACTAEQKASQTCELMALRNVIDEGWRAGARHAVPDLLLSLTGKHARLARAASCEP